MYSHAFATHCASVGGGVGGRVGNGVGTAVGASVGCGVGIHLQIAYESIDEGPQSEQVLKKMTGVAPGV